MFELLFKVFIKNSDEVENGEVRRNYGVFGGAVGIFLNICLFSIKLVAGLVTSSIGIVADALNNLSDAGSSIITLIGFKLSGKPADHDHPFGHGRIEYISALFVALAILMMGLELIKTSSDKIMHPQPVTFSWLSVAILIIAILTKTWMYFFNKKIGVKISSNSMQVTAKDSLSDSVSTAAVLLGSIIAHYANINLDGYLGIIVALFILYTGYGTISDSLSPLLGQAPDSELVGEIEGTVMSHKEIIGIHDLIIHNYGPTRMMMSLHAEIPSNSNMIEIHDTIDVIERELAQKFECDAVIHMDPIETDNQLINDMREYVNEIVYNIDSSLTIHDFRMVSGTTHTNLIFDVVVPYDFKYSNDELKKIIQDKISEKNISYFVVMTVDKKYI